MLKGLKLKTKLPEKDNNAPTQPSQPPARVEEDTAAPAQGKRWLKPSEGQSRGESSQGNKLTEDDLISTCKEIWESYIGGQMEDAEKQLKDLKKKESRFYENKKQETAIVNKHILEEPEKEEDIFASVERTALKNFDQRKSAYLVTDILAETVKSKGRDADDSVYKMYKKKGVKVDIDNLYDEEYDLKEGEQDENKKKSKREKKLEQKEKKKEAMEANRAQRVLANCRYCLNNNQIIEEQILSFSPGSLLLLPDIKKYKQDHYYIIPIEHASSQIEIDDDHYDEIKNYLKCLISMYDKKDYGVVFMETYINVEKSPHCIIEAVAMPREIHEELPLYFKKALTELESEWATHKKIIEIRKEKGGIRKQIPKNFPYFYIDFDTTFGYAHVIEKTKDYNKNFAHEILGSLLNVDKNMTMFPKRFERRELAQIKEDFLDKWSDYDWTKML